MYASVNVLADDLLAGLMIFSLLQAFLSSDFVFIVCILAGKGRKM